MRKRLTEGGREREKQREREMEANKGFYCTACDSHTEREGESDRVREREREPGMEADREDRVTAAPSGHANGMSSCSYRENVCLPNGTLLPI